MSRRSLGSGGEANLRPGPVFFPLAAFLLLFSLMMAGSGVWAAEDTGARSGVVEPKVTVVRPMVRGESPQLEEFEIPTKYSSPFGLAIDSKGRVWFTEMAGNSLGVLDPSTGELKEYRIPSTVGLPEIEWEYDPKKRDTPEKAINVYSVGGPGNVVVDKDGYVWFVMQLGNSVVRFDPGKEEFTEFLIPTANSLPYDLAADSRGRIWFVEKNAGKIGYLDPSAEKVAEIDIGQGANIMGIAIDSSDKVWIGEVNANIIGRYDPETRKFRKFTINVPRSQPGSMRFDKDGRLWICHLQSQQIGVLMPDPGIHSVVPLPGYNTVPQGLAPDEDGRIWVVDSMTNKVGFFDSISLRWKLFNIPTANAQAMNVAVDSRGDVWFTESDRHANKIARLVVSTIPKEEERPGKSAQGPENAAAGAGSGGGGESAMGSGLVKIVIFAVVLVAALALLGFVVLRRSGSGR